MILPLHTVASITGLSLVLWGLGLEIQHVHATRPLAWQARQQRVGAVDGKCCKPGRHFGCNPSLFNQSGCTPIAIPLTNCQPNGWLAMQCSSATCVASNPEHTCSVDYRLVGRNVCHPTGERTTLGCPQDQWQCKIDMIEYTQKSAPKVEVLVCRYDVSTICDHNYSDCD